MEEVKQILVVDDYFQMLEFLRSVLEFSHHEYQVLAVPSAEEGILELRRTPFDLVITDVRLPGISGFDMVRKIKELNPTIPIIMITAYSSEQGKREADELGVKRYFKKPLDPDELLATVHTILYGVEERGIEVDEESAEEILSLDVRRRLETLRSDTAARHVMLSNMSGQVLYDGGVGRVIGRPTLATSIADNMRTSFLLTRELDSLEPFTIQYQSGNVFDLYCANVGREYIVSIFLDAQERRGRLGTIWVFAQRAINDLQALLADEIPAGPITDVQPEMTAPEPVVELKEPEPVEAAVGPDEPEVEEVEPEAAEEMDTFSLDDIREFLGIEPPDDDEEIDLDSFWDEALEESGQGNLGSSGMSLEEAREQGLIPTEFDQPGQPTESE